MAISFVNSTAATFTASASTWSMRVQTGLTGGGALIVGLGPGSSAVTVSAVTDNAGNAFSLAVRRATPRPAAVGAELWYATNISSASTRISVTLSGASSGTMACAHFTGISTANALLNTGNNAITANSTTHTGADITPSESSALVISFSRLSASTVGAITVLGGMSVWQTTNAASVRCAGLYSVQTAASSASGSFTTSSNCQHATVIAAFSDTRTITPVSYSGGLMSLGWGM